MSDTQLLTIALATVPTVIVVMIGILLNNSRLSDLRQDVLGRMADFRAEMERRFAEMDRRFAAVERRLDSVETKIDLLTGKVIEFDNRLTRVEAHLGLK
jgi:septal ring factor EnvC (AmiA/AmiB activator)